MASLDAFLKRATRLPRLGRLGSQVESELLQLVQEAVKLLPQHADRSTEIAMAVGRLGGEPKSVAKFAAAYQELLRKRLPESDRFSKAQAREALAAYVAIEGLGCDTGSLASRASTAAELLEAHELTAALARLAAARSAAQGLMEQRTLNGAQDVAVALQNGLLNKGDALHALSAQDLCNAVVGIARSPLQLPDAVAAIATAARGRCSELRTFRSMLDFCRAMGELMAAVEGQQREQVSECLAETFSVIASEVQSSFQGGEADQIGLCLSGLVRIAATLPPESSEAFKFVAEVISPSAESILLACHDDDLQFFEVAAPLLQLAGGEAWIKLLRYLALEGLQKLPDSPESISRLISIMEWVAQKDGHLVCPPFFDFAVQELSQRIGTGVTLATAADIRKAAKLLTSVHLERPDLLPASATAIAKTSVLVQPEDLPEVALSLSAMAGLSLRLAPLIGASKDAPKENKGDDDTAMLAQSFEVSSQTARHLLSPANAQSDAAFLALSAFAQACRHGDSADSVRRRVVLSGVQLLDALCQAWTSAWNQGKLQLSLQQAHIFVTCMRTFCIGKGAPSPPPSTLHVLEAVVQSIAAADHKDARLCLAVLQEIHADPICPPLLKSLLEAQGVQGAQKGHGQGETGQVAGDARERLRASMASPTMAAQNPQGGFLRRIFGL